MNNPKITVIVPVYNSERYLPQCIDSILEQTFQNLELILVDDGSLDGSGKICDEYAQEDARVHVFHKENGGVSEARNIGLDNARGEWVCFVDSDDLIDSHFFENALKNDSFDLITISFKEFGATSSTQGVKENLVYQMNPDAFRLLNFSPNDKTKTPYLSSCMHLLRRGIIKESLIRFNPTLRFGEDTIFMVSYLQHCHKVIQLADIYYFYRIEENAFTRKYRLNAKETNRHCKALTDAIEKYCKTFHCPVPQLYYSNFSTYLRAFNNYLVGNLYYGEFREALKTLDIKYSKLLYAGRKFAIKIFLMRLFPRIAYKSVYHR